MTESVESCGQSQGWEAVQTGMDETDQRIADFLREDARASNRAIGDALQLSPRLVGSRIDSMCERRALRVSAVADVFEAGNDLVLAVGVAVRGRATLEVAEELAALEEVCAVNVVSGEFDLEVLILSADHDTLREFVSTRVSSIRGIESLSPALSLELFKFESAWSRF